MLSSFLPSIFLALILSETVAHCRGPERPPDNACYSASNPVVKIVVHGQNSRYERCENERNSDLAPYQLSSPANAEFGASMLFSCVTVISADVTPVLGGLLLVPFDQSAKPFPTQQCKRHPPHCGLLLFYEGVTAL
jgi:hypothetical protein